MTKPNHQPSDGARLPEHYDALTIGGVLPFEPVFAYTMGSVVMDPVTRDLYVDETYKLDKEYSSPSFPGNRAGVMRVVGLEPGEGKSSERASYDGYVVDLVYVDRGHVQARTLSVSGDASEGDTQFAASERAKCRRVLAARILDIDDVLQLVGDSRMFDYLTTLASANDALRQPESATQQPEATVDLDAESAPPVNNANSDTANAKLAEENN